MNLIDDTYVIFDLETTGLDPNLGCSIIEIGAVRMKQGVIINRFDELINPGCIISDEIISITGITNEMVVSCDNEEQVVKRFVEWCGSDKLVAHNAKFDLSFIKMAYFKYNLGRFNFDVIDTLGMSRFLTPNERYHNLTCLMSRYNIEWDENKHHRADYDSEGTGLILMKMLEMLDIKNIKNFVELNNIPFIVLNKKV